MVCSRRTFAENALNLDVVHPSARARFKGGRTYVSIGSSCYGGLNKLPVFKVVESAA